MNQKDVALFVLNNAALVTEVNEKEANNIFAYLVKYLETVKEVR